MRRRKVLESTLVFGLASILCTYFIGEYIRAVADAGDTPPHRILIAVFAGFALAAYQAVQSLQFARAGWNPPPWMPGRGEHSLRHRWAWCVPMALFLADLSLRAYQSIAGADLIHLPEVFVALFAMSSATSAIESFRHRRWLLSLP